MIAQAREVIDSLSDDKQVALVVPVWIGRCDFVPVSRAGPLTTGHSLPK